MLRQLRVFRRLRLGRLIKRPTTPPAKPSPQRLALRSMGIWLVFLMFSIAILSLFPREIHGTYSSSSPSTMAR